MRVLKIAYFEIKQMYRRWYSILPSLFIAIIGSFSIVITGNPKIILDYLSFLIIVMILTSYVPLRYYSITKSVIDFVFTTQIDPVEYYIANAIAAGLLYPIFLIAFTVFTVRLNPTIIYCLLNALILSGFFVLFTSNVRMGSWRSKLLLSAPILTVICLGFLKPEISPLYGLIEPKPIYIAYSLALLVLAILTIPKNNIRGLAVNAYEILSVRTPMPRSMGGAGVAGSIEFPRTVWGVIWATSTHNRNLRSGARYNVFRGLAIASTSLAIVYTVLALLIRGTISQVFLSAFSFYMVYFYLYIFASSTISNERLWLNLSIEPTRYFRYRMLARTLIMTVALLPWIAAYSIQGIYFRPAIYLAIALIPIIMSAPSLSWLAAAYVGVPQRRELQLVQRPVTHSLRIYLIFLVLFITLAIYMTPYSLALVTIYYPRLSILGLIGDAFTALILAASTVFFYYAVVSERGRGMWAWLVNRLSEFGYV